MQKGGLEIVYNLEWKNRIYYGEETSNMVGIVDDPANALDYETFKTYLLKNSGSSLGIDNVRVSYNKNGQQHFIDTPGAFERALSTFRRRAKAGKVTTLTLEYVNPIYVTKQCDVHTQVEQDQKNPPEWFTTYMVKFKEDIVKEISTNIAVKIYKPKDPVKEVTPSCKIRDKNVHRTSYKTEAKVVRGNLSSAMNKSTIKIQNFKLVPQVVTPSACRDPDKDEILNLLVPHEHGGESACSKHNPFVKRDKGATTQTSSGKFFSPQKKENLGNKIWFMPCPSASSIDCRENRHITMENPSTSDKVDAPCKIFDTTKFLATAACSHKRDREPDIATSVYDAAKSPPRYHLVPFSTGKGANILDVDFVNCKQLQKSRMCGGEDYIFNWNIKNTGTVNWTEQTHVRYAWGSEELIPHHNKIECPRLKVGEIGSIAVEVKLPVSPGKYMCHFKFYNNDEIFGKWFGIEVTIDQSPGLNPRYIRKPIYDVITIHDAYELVLPNKWTTPRKIADSSELKNETIVPQKLTSETKNRVEVVAPNPLLEATTVAEIKDSTEQHQTQKSASDDLVDIKLLAQNISSIPELHKQEPQQLLEDKIINKYDGKDNTDIGDKPVLSKAELPDYEQTQDEVNVKEDSSDDDQSIISIPDSVKSIHSNTSEEFVHLKFSSPDVSNAQEFSESENISEDFDELDDFPKVEIVLSNDVTHQLDDAINDDSEEKPSNQSESIIGNEVDNLKTGNSDSIEDVSIATPSHSSDSSSDFAYVIYEGEKIPVAKKYLRDDYLATAEEVPMKRAENIEEHVKDNCLPIESSASSSIESECSYHSPPKSSNSCGKKSPINITNFKSPYVNIPEAREPRRMFEATTNEDHNMATSSTDPKDKSGNSTNSSTPNSDHTIKKAERFMFLRYNTNAFHATSQTSVPNSDEVIDKKKDTADKTETEKAMDYSPSMSNTVHTESDSNDQSPTMADLNRKFIPGYTSRLPIRELVEYIAPAGRLSYTGDQQETTNAGTQYRNTPEMASPPIGYEQPFLTSLKRKIGKFRRGLSSSITEVVGILPDLLDDAKADGYWRNGEWVSTNPATNRGLALNMLHEMGFQNRDYNEALLVRYNNDLNKVVTELLSYLK